MSKPTSSVKRKYNKAAYQRYEFSVRIDSSLNYMLEQQKSSPEGISGLVKELLCQHFGVSSTDIYVPDHIDR